MNKAQLKHLEELDDLYKVIIASQSDLEPYYYQKANQSKEFIKSMITNPDSDILITLNQNEVTGFSAIKEVESPGYPMFIKRKSAYILDLVVMPEYRRQGLAQKLLRDSVTWKEERKLDYLELCVLESNQAGLKLYETAGFDTFSRQMILK